MLSIDPVMTRFAVQGDVNGLGKTKIAMEEMEHLFLNTLMKEMRKSVPEGGLFEKSPASQLFEEMLDDVYSGEMAKSGQLGLANILLQEMEQQEATLAIRGKLYQQQLENLAQQQVKQPGEIAEIEV